MDENEGENYCSEPPQGKDNDEKNYSFLCSSERKDDDDEEEYYVDK